MSLNSPVDAGESRKESTSKPSGPPDTEGSKLPGNESKLETVASPSPTVAISGAEQTPLDPAVNPNGADSVFHLFPKLPAEIRVKVWDIVSSWPRIVHVRVKTLPRGRGRLPKEIKNGTRHLRKFLSNSSVPPILHVNRESRYEGLKIYEPRLIATTKRPSATIYFNKAVDTIYFVLEGCREYNTEYLDVFQHFGIQFLAVNLDQVTDYDALSLSDEVCDDLLHLTELKVLTFCNEGPVSRNKPTWDHNERGDLVLKSFDSVGMFSGLYPRKQDKTIEKCQKHLHNQISYDMQNGKVVVKLEVLEVRLMRMFRLPKTEIRKSDDGEAEAVVNKDVNEVKQGR